MSVYLTCDEEPGDLVASNRGWGDFGRWVDTLDADEFPHLCQLWEHGVTEPVSAFRKELAKALKLLPPTDDSATAVANAVAELIAGWDVDDPVIVHN